MILADTSALLAVFDPDDRRHEAASRVFERGAGSFVTTSYLVAESLALIQRRFALGKARDFVNELLQPIDVAFIDERLHELGLASFLAANRRGDSFVDHVSFALMRDRGIRTAFTLDQDFARAGFEVVP